jgi:transposase
MDDEALLQRALHLRQVEKLSIRQIAGAMGIDRKKITRLLKGVGTAIKIPKKGVLDEYIPLMAQWYKQYPNLMAKQTYERLKEYGYEGSYRTVVRVSEEYRKIQPRAYHPLTFLPGEEAQVDWFYFKHERLGAVAGFVYVLSYSRYAWGIFYPKTTFEFFLAGHLECFKKIGGLARRHRYDNTKSVIIKREPTIEYNPQFLDFASFFGFSIHVCNPYSGNEKGRVERLIRHIRTFLYGEDFIDLADLNRKFYRWLEQRNNTVHRSTNQTPQELLLKERLVGLPAQSYAPRRIVGAVASKTALVEFETNKYSVPSSCTGKAVEVVAYPERIEICINGQEVARHRRCFGKMQSIQNPLHAEKHLNHTPQFKMKRILELITAMDPVFNQFIEHQEDESVSIEVAYQLFTLLKTHSRAILLSAVRELNGMRCFKIKALMSLLNLPQQREPKALWPQNQQLLNLTYEERNLNDYDPA